MQKCPVHIDLILRPTVQGSKVKERQNLKLHLQSKNTCKRPSFYIFKRELKQYFKILKYQASCNFEIHKFMRKWHLWLPLVT